MKLSENETNWHHQFLTYIMYLSHVTLPIDVWMSWTEINFFKIKEKWYTAFVLMLFPKFHAKLVGTSKAEQCRNGSHRKMLVWKQGYCAYLQDNTTFMRAFSCIPPFLPVWGYDARQTWNLKRGIVTKAEKAGNITGYKLCLKTQQHISTNPLIGSS